MASTQSGPFTVEVGQLCQGAQTIGHGLSYQDALELCESKMNLMGGSWQQPYPTSNGHHFYQISNHEPFIPENAKYVFMGCVGYFPAGTH